MDAADLYSLLEDSLCIVRRAVWSEYDDWAASVEQRLMNAMNELVEEDEDAQEVSP
jgi:hypothetical protein